jgi:NAD(P)-dependent dehydrogenase (short-subunit alcohol dehydrogenase family)
MTHPATPKTWFITGTSTGFGLSFARHALERGDNVVATARRPQALASLVASAPDRVLAVALDVTAPGAPQAAVDAALARFGRIDVVVNNAGYGSVGAVEETPEHELRAQLETNFFGAAAVIRAVLPTLRAQRSGAIVNVSSMGGNLSFAGFGAYSASKFALEGLSEALAQEVAPFGIKVLIVEPGAFRTAFAGSALKRMPEIAAYRETAGASRAFADGMHGTQAGDPDKAARAVAQALDAPVTPLRLQLGHDAIDGVRAHAQQLLQDLAAWEAVGRATVYDGQAA